MSAAGQSDSDSGGRPDSCQTVPACPLPPFRKRLETSKAAAAPEPPISRSLGPVLGTAAPRKGLKSLPNLGSPRGESGARAPAARGGRGSRCLAGGVRRAGRGRGGGFPGSAGPKALACSRGPASSGALPERRAGGPPAAPGRMLCPGPGPQRSHPPLPRAPVADSAEAENHTSGRSPQTPRVPSPPPPPGAGPAGAASSPEPGSAPGNGRCFSREGFLERSGDGGVGRAREAGAAAGQSRSAFRALPGSRGNLRASPHPAQLLAAFPPRPCGRPPIPARRRLEGGAWRDVTAPSNRLAHSSPSPVLMDRHLGPVGRGWAEPLGPAGWVFIFANRPHLHRLHLPPRFLGGSPAP